MLSRGVTVALSALALVALAERPAGGQASLPHAPVEVSLDPYFRQLTTVQVTSGSQSLTLLLDTGGGQTLITPEAAGRLGCVPFGMRTGYRMSGERVVFQRCESIPLRIGGVPLNAPEVGVFDLMALLPPELPKLDGVLSLDSFDGLVVTIELPNRLILESAGSAAPRRGLMTALTARRATGEGGNALTVFLAADAPRGPLWMLLDSGNLVGAILSPAAVSQLGVAPSSIQAEGDTRFIADMPLRVRGLEALVGRVVVSDLIHDGALGADFMARGRVMFDLRDERLWVGFEPRR